MHLKAENLQRTGSFKARGAVSKIGHAVRRRARGRRRRGERRQPRAGRGLGGARGRHPGADLRAAGRADVEGRGLPALRRGDDHGRRAFRGRARGGARATSEETGATFVHPYEDPADHRRPGHDRARARRAGAGRGDRADPDRRRRPRRRDRARAARGAPAACGSSACRPGGDGYTIADGIAVKQPGDLTGAILDDVLDDVVDVSDDEICEAIVLLLERAKLLVEGAGAVAVAALLAGKAGGSGPVVCLLSGGNIDPTILISVMRHGLTAAGPLPRRAHAPRRPARRADQAAVARRRGARQPDLGRAPPRGHGHPGQRDRGRADDGDARRGSTARRCSARWPSTGTPVERLS